jgi:dihydropteroate synthase
MIFRARQVTLTFPRPALVMGIINVTPDSFYDGGKFLDPAAAVAHGLELIAQGAEILDVGGDSSRPGSVPATETEELARVIPVIESLAGQTDVPLSIDTTKPEVARAALAAGASIVNDVAAHREDTNLWRIVVDYRAGYVCMHALETSPAKSSVDPGNRDAIVQVHRFFSDRLGRMISAGMVADQVIFDVGIGFGKSVEDNLRLLGGLAGFVGENRPLLLGVSRKSFIGKVTGAELNQRLPASLACASMAIAAGVHIIRTHDVAATVQAVRMTEAILAHRK